MEYPKMLYRGNYSPEIGLGPLDKITVNSSAEEKEQAKEGFVCADDLETLIPADLKPKAEKSKKKSADDGE